MLSFIDISPIITGHLNNLKDFNTKRLSLGTISLFVLFPLLAGIAAAATGHEVTDVERVALTLFMSVTGGMLLALMTILPIIFTGEGPNPHMAGLRRRLLFEVRATLSFCVLVAGAAITLILIGLVDPLKYAVVGLVYFVATAYVLTAMNDLVTRHKVGELRASAGIKGGVALVVIASSAAIFLIDSDTVIGYVTVGATYFLVVTFLLNMLVVVRRLNILVGKEFESNQEAF